MLILSRQVSVYQITASQKLILCDFMWSGLVSAIYIRWNVLDIKTKLLNKFHPHAKWLNQMFSSFQQWVTYTRYCTGLITFYIKKRNLWVLFDHLFTPLTDKVTVFCLLNLMPLDWLPYLSALDPVEKLAYLHV